MNSEAPDSSHAFAEIAINKKEKQDKRITDIESQIKTLAGNAEIKQLTSAIAVLKENLGQSKVDEEKLSALAAQIDELLNTLASPPTHKVLHHHHIPKIIWAMFFMAMLTCIMSAGWFYTSRKLDGFIANDTKYRALKLDTALYPLRQYLDKLDSVYAINPAMRDEVLQKEEQYIENFYRVQKAMRLKEEARQLEKEAGRK
ncbi:MAG: hypothetical protein QM763_18965 [Agriterribacter sp.]